MRFSVYLLALSIALLAGGCGNLVSSGSDGGGPPPGTPDAGPGPGEPDAGPGPGEPDAAPPVDDTVAQLLALVQSCDHVVGGQYATDYENAPSINVCGLTGAVFWKADFDIDCDGKRTAVCNEQTDGAYQPRTSATDSNGEFLDASQLPYVVIPLPSNRWNYNNSGIDLGTVVAVIYNGKLAYGVFGDQGPDNIIGEASYKLATLLGIDPDPSSGGTEGPVYYIAFTGGSGMVSKIEDHAEAVQVGQTRTEELLQAN